MSNFVLMTEIYEDRRLDLESYLLREVLINPKNIMMLRDDPVLKEKITARGWPEGLDKRVEFCKLSMSTGASHSTSISVVGDMRLIIEKLGMGEKNICM